MRLAAARGSAAMLALAAALVAGAAPARAADDYVDCLQVDAAVGPTVDDSDSVPDDLLGVLPARAALAAAGRTAGGGVAVAVLDSGISTRSPLLHVVARRGWPHRELTSAHGTVVAGLIAAGDRDGRPTGVAPDADLVDVRVHDGSATGPGAVDPDEVARGLDWVADHAAELHIRVANVSLALPDIAVLRRAVRRVVHDADVVLVAASGNRPTDEADPLWARFNAETGTETGPGEDVAGDVFPAGYPDVVAVNATTGGTVDQSQPLSAFVLPNSETDLAAPTFFGVSVGLDGGTCRVAQVATSFAAAEVSGVVALLRARYPHEHAVKIVARLEGSASGTLGDPTPFEGYGVVQPLEALTRPVSLGTDGRVSVPTGADVGGGRAGAPTPRADTAAAAREHAVWWGLLGGGALLLALLLRPVFSGRRA